MGKKKDVVIGETIEEKKEPQKSEEVTSEKKAEVKQKKAVRSHTKRYLTARAAISPGKVYSVKEGVSLVKKNATEKFDSSIELHLVVDETGLKGEVTLPHGTGKEVRVAVFSPEIETKLEDNIIDFDVLIAQPDDMKKLVKYAKLLGPRGLMPSPKKGTVTPDVAKSVKKFQAGSFHYKTEAKFPLIHQVVGKKSFDEKQLAENITAFITAVGTKHVLRASLSSSMGPSISLDTSTLG